MKIKSTQAKLFMDTFSNLKNQKLPITLAFKLNKISNSMEKDYIFFQTKASEIFREYCEKDENNQPILSENGEIHILQENIEECNTKLMELENLEFEVSDIKIPISEFDGIEIELSLMEGLMPFIEE